MPSSTQREEEMEMLLVVKTWIEGIKNLSPAQTLAERLEATERVRHTSIDEMAPRKSLAFDSIRDAKSASQQSILLLSPRVPLL